MKKINLKTLKHYRFLNKGAFTKSNQSLILFLNNEKKKISHTEI